jgi:hypothetical protein
MGVVVGRREGSMDEAVEMAEMRFGNARRFGTEGRAACSVMVGKVVSPATEGVLGM